MQADEKAKKCHFFPWWSWPLTLTFKLVRARDQICLPCEFGANPFSGSQDISYTNKQVTDSAKIESYAVHCVRQQYDDDDDVATLTRYV